MDKPNIVVTFHPVQGQQTFLNEILGRIASLTFLTDLEPRQREQALEEASVLLSWNFPREIQPQDYPHLRRVLLIQLLSAGADHIPFADLPRSGKRATGFSHGDELPPAHRRYLTHSNETW